MRSEAWENFDWDKWNGLFAEVAMWFHRHDYQEQETSMTSVCRECGHTKML